LGTRTKAEVGSSQRSVGRSAAAVLSVVVAVKMLSRSSVTVAASKERWKAAAVGSASASSVCARQSSAQGETQAWGQWQTGPAPARRGFEAMRGTPYSERMR
jgi:hypothetical protein